MGVDYYAYAVIGVKVKRDDLYGPPQKVKAFKHDYPEDMAFSPKDGRKLWDEESLPIPGVDVVNETFNGLTILGLHEGDDDYVLVGRAFRATYRDPIAKLSIPSDDEDDLRETLGALPAKGEIGIWAYLHCS